MIFPTTRGIPLGICSPTPGQFLSRLSLVGWGLLAALLVASTFEPRLFAQESDAKNSSGDSEAKSSDVEPVTWEKLVYLPYKQLSAVFEKQKATVFMSYAEYLKLWSGAQEQPAVAPVEAVITSAGYRVQIDQDVARIEAEYSVRVLGKEWSQLPLKFGDAAVGSLTHDAAADQKALLRATGDGTYSLLFPKPGNHTIKLQLAARVRSSPDGKSFELEVPAVGVTKFELTIPEADQAVEVTPLLVRQPAEGAKPNETRIVGNLSAAGKLSALWHPKASIKPEMDLLASVTNHLHVLIADGLVHTDAFLRYDVLRGELTQLRVAVPKGDRILGVSSNDANVKSWKAFDEANRQVVTVELLSPAKKAITLEVHTERAAVTEAMGVVGLNENAPVSGIHALDVVRESGQLVVTKGSDLLLNVEGLTGLTRIEDAEVAELIRRPGALAYKFYSPKVELKLIAKPVEPRVLVGHVARLQFLDDELRALTQLNYTVERAGLFELLLRVPEGLKVDQVSGPYVKEHNVDVRDGGSVLRVVLDMKREGQIEINIVSHRTLEVAKEQNLTLPLLEPLQVERETGQVTIFAAEAIEVLTDEKNIKGVQPERNADPDPPFDAGGTLASAWTFTRRPIEIPVKTTRRPTRLTASVATTLNAKPESAEVRSTVTYQVQFAGLDTFQLAVPEAYADRVQIRTAQEADVPAIKEKKKAEQSVDGWVTWTIILQREAIGDVPLEVTYDLKLTNAAQPAQGDKPGAAATSWRQELKLVKALGLPGEGESQAGKVELADVYGEVTVHKDKALTVSADAVADDLEAIDPRELTLLSQDGSLAYRYYSQPVALMLLAAKHEIQEVVETVISRGLIEIVLDEDDKASYRCRFRLKTSERQRLRLDLPKGAEILGVLVDNKLVSPERGGQGSDDAYDSYFVSVARGGKSDETFTVTVQFLWPVNPRPFVGWSGRVRGSLPRLGGPKGSAVAVQQLRTVLWVPEKFSLVGTPDHFVREQRLTLERALDGDLTSSVQQSELDNWIGASSVGVADFATQGQGFSYHNLGGADAIEVTWWKVSFAAIVATCSLFVLGLVLIPTSWRNRIGWVLLGALIAICTGLNDADTALHAVAAARWGILLMFGQWIAHTLFSAARRSNGATMDWSKPFPATVIPPPDPGS
jgi:hypothetical protein